jgi:glyoxylate/hydroxypyruvate reductase
VDLHALYRRKVRLGYTPDVLTDAGEPHFAHLTSIESYSKLLKVADVSVMLALMAGRNAGAGVTLVKEGKVC